MARTRTPEHLRAVKGMDKKNPSRRNDNEPQPPVMGIGEPPKHLNENQKDIWNEMVLQMPGGVLGSSDRIAFELIAKLVWESRFNYEEFTGAKLAQLNSLLSRFGMTPSDRSKISIPQKKEESRYEKYRKV